jgi:hypothetical protein
MTEISDWREGASEIGFFLAKFDANGVKQWLAD